MTKKVIQIENIDYDTFLSAIADIVVKKVKEMEEVKEVKGTIVDRFLTKKEVAEIFAVSEVTIWQWSRKGILKSYHIGNKVRFLHSEVMSSAISKRR